MTSRAHHRAGKVEEALVFAQEQLAPQGEANPQFLEELEQTLALLAFADPAAAAAAAASPLAAQLGSGDEGERRRATASELNAAILSRQGGLGVDERDPTVTEPALQMLIKELLWRQRRLAEAGVDFPRVPAEDLLYSTQLVYKDGSATAPSTSGEGSTPAAPP